MSATFLHDMCLLPVAGLSRSPGLAVMYYLKQTNPQQNNQLLHTTFCTDPTKGSRKEGPPHFHPATGLGDGLSTCSKPRRCAVASGQKGESRGRVGFEKAERIPTDFDISATVLC